MESVWLTHVRSSEDNWVGITDAAQRRRIQNRLAQRARRAKKFQRPPDKPTAPRAHITSVASDTEEEVIELPMSFEPLVELADDIDWSLFDFTLDSTRNVSLPPSDIDTFNTDVTSSLPIGSYGDASLNHDHRPSIEFGCPTPPSTADTQNPLPSPSRLMFSCMYAIAALWHNGGLMHLTCGPSSILHPKPGVILPPALSATALQRTVVHPVIIDCLPFPSMRDRILGALSIINAEELRNDLVNLGLRCWGRRPWDARGWEIPGEFVDKWWFLMDDETVQMTNFWREEQDMEPLIWRGTVTSNRVVRELC